MLLENAIAEGLKVVNKFIPDKDQQAKFEAEFRTAVLTSDTQLAVAQTEINKVEAASESVFISGARPFILWVCGFALAYHFIAQPLLAFVLSSFGHIIALPVFDMDSLNTILMGLLGLGTLRTVEKVRK